MFCWVHLLCLPCQVIANLIFALVWHVNHESEVAFRHSCRVHCNSWLIALKLQSRKVKGSEMWVRWFRDESFLTAIRIEFEEGSEYRVSFETTFGVSHLKRLNNLMFISKTLSGFIWWWRLISLHLFIILVSSFSDVLGIPSLMMTLLECQRFPGSSMGFDVRFHTRLRIHVL